MKKLLIIMIAVWSLVALSSAEIDVAGSARMGISDLDEIAVPVDAPWLMAPSYVDSEVCDGLKTAPPPAAPPVDDPWLMAPSYIDPEVCDGLKTAPPAAPIAPPVDDPFLLAHGETLDDIKPRCGCTECLEDPTAPVAPPVVGPGLWI